ncbi:MAG: ATP-binding protein [Candidatus Gracilibacteria bacterium]|jgi:anti-sigma regulatory factor (Ser/Thr protein kinase)
MAEENKKTEPNLPTKISITFPSTAYFVSGIRDFTLNLVKNLTEFPEKWAYRFQSVIDELCNNAIEYGSAAGSDVRVTFTDVKGDYLEIAVEDTGTGKNPMKAAEIQKLFEERRATGYMFTGIRGRGLAKIVGEWTDEIRFEDRKEGGTIITVKKYIKDQRFASDLLKPKDSVMLDS